MKKITLLLVVVAVIGSLQGCATAKGAVGGAAIGGLAGDASKGARIGATAGLMVDILN